MRQRSFASPMRQFIATLALWASTVALAVAAQLLVVDQPNCPYCEQFDAEIAKAWPKTNEGQRAPLRRVALHDAWPEDLANVKPAMVTPTFILIDDGQEVDRLVGYPGNEAFWFLIGGIISQLDDES